MQQQCPCQTCNATGKTHSKESLCGRCAGKSTTTKKTVVEVKIPPGAPNGFIITKKGLADEQLELETGDFHFVVREKPHSRFTRIVNDLAIKITVDLATALIGGKVTFDHIDGTDLTITLPKGKIIRYGDTMCVKEKGMPHLTGEGFGDLRITFIIELPSDDWAKTVNETVVRRVLMES